MKQNNVYPKSFSHIGITVPNLEKAVEFYSNVMGWYIINATYFCKRRK